MYYTARPHIHNRMHFNPTKPYFPVCCSSTHPKTKLIFLLFHTLTITYDRPTSFLYPHTSIALLVLILVVSHFCKRPFGFSHRHGTVTFQGSTSRVINVRQAVLLMLQQHWTTKKTLYCLSHFISYILKAHKCRTTYIRVVQYILDLHKPTVFLSLALIMLNHSQCRTSLTLPILSQLLPHVTFLRISHH